MSATATTRTCSRETSEALAVLAKAAGVVAFAVDPRGQNDDLAADPVKSRDYLTATRASLRMIADSSGGFLIFELQHVSNRLKRMEKMVRR